MVVISDLACEESQSVIRSDEFVYITEPLAPILLDNEECGVEGVSGITMVVPNANV